IRLGPESSRVDWVIAQDNSTIAWTLTGTDPQGRLQTRTTVANLDGTQARPVLTDVDTSGSRLRALPISLVSNANSLYMDNHPDGISAFTAFDQYVGVFELDLTTGQTTLLPGEAGNSCICGADIRDTLFVRLRLRLTADSSGFEVHIYDLSNDTETVLPPVELEDFNTAGDVLIAPDGSLALYALARVEEFNTPQQFTETVFVLVDLVNMTQVRLTPNPITTYVRPVSWTEDNSAIIFTSPDETGTWKINTTDGRLERIADATYLGIMRP
ncbi:MAG: hypothetical protein ACOCX5_03370, partial [Chloroflexota bacterium]